MKFREARRLKQGDVIVESATDTVYQVTSIEVFMDAKQVRIYAQVPGNGKLTSIFYNKEIELQ